MFKKGKLPQHVAIIMDGNGRWAKKHKLPRTAGHQQGVQALKRIIEAAMEYKIPYLSVFAFSIENFKRPREEIDFLFNLLAEHIKKDLAEFKKNGICLKILGFEDNVSAKLVKMFHRAEDETKNNKKLFLQILFNYGARQELVRAVQQIAENAAAGKINTADISEQTLSQTLFTAGLPDPDLIIRTSGEMRLSNFFLWQSAYSEFYFTPCLWPDFNKREFAKALTSFNKRERRFGNT